MSIDQRHTTTSINTTHSRDELIDKIEHVIEKNTTAEPYRRTCGGTPLEAA